MVSPFLNVRIFQMPFDLSLIVAFSSELFLELVLLGVFSVHLLSQKKIE